MAARSVLVKFENGTSEKLKRTYAKLSHGVWTDNMLPPEFIDADSSGSWQSESDGFMTGTEGECKYLVPDAGEVKITWDNPFAGHNAYTITAPEGYSGSHTSGSGDNATVTFTISKD